MKSICSHSFLLLCVLILTSGCATPYQATNFTGGHNEIQLNDRKFEVSFAGNGFTSESVVRKYLLLRCAELTLENGFSHFLIMDGSTKSHTSIAKFGNDQVAFQANGYGQATATFYEAARIPVTRHKGNAMIYLVNWHEMDTEMKMASVDADLYISQNNMTNLVGDYDAESPSNQRSNSKGFYLQGHFNGTGASAPDYGNEVESGGGGGLKVGYGFSRLFTLYFGVDAAVMESVNGFDQYGLAHADLGGQFNFRSGRNAFVPYLDLALTGLGMSYEVNNSMLTASGVGGSFGGGFKYYVSRPLALDLGIGWTIGSFTEATYRGRTENFNLDVTSARVNLGLSWYPQR